MTKKKKRERERNTSDKATIYPLRGINVIFSYVLLEFVINIGYFSLKAINPLQTSWTVDTEGKWDGRNRILAPDS